MIISQSGHEGIPHMAAQTLGYGLQAPVTLAHALVDVQELKVHQIDVGNGIILQLPLLGLADHFRHVIVKLHISVKTGDRIDARALGIKLPGDHEDIEDIPLLRIRHQHPVILHQTFISLLGEDLENDMPGTVQGAADREIDIPENSVPLLFHNHAFEAVPHIFGKFLIILTFKKTDHILVRKKKLMPLCRPVGKSPTGHAFRKMLRQILMWFFH